MVLINIIIGTTSLNRPELHLTILPKWIEWITAIDKQKYKISWYVNIDVIDHLPNNFEETVENYKKMIIGHTKCTPINSYFVKSEDGSSNFLNACKRLANSIEACVSSFDSNNDITNTKIFWLEDDWELTNISNVGLEELLELYSSNLTNLNLTSIKNNYIHALAPSIFSYTLWKMIHYQAWTNQSSYVDAEQCAGKYYLNNYGKFCDIQSFTVLMKNVGEHIIKNITSENNARYTCHRGANVVRNGFIERFNVLSEIRDKVTLIRIYPRLCDDKGKQFMVLKNIIKKNDKYDENFYEPIEKM